jgi:hypothetical protein
MIIVTRDYKSGTSSAIFDYRVNNVVCVDQDAYTKAFDIRCEDILFIGHDFLSFLWDTDEKINHWRNYKRKKIIWCFERVLSIVPEWRERGLAAYKNVAKFADKILVSDEEDAAVLNQSWLPQWSSPLFYINREKIKPVKKILFTGQAGTRGYEKRDALLKRISSNVELSRHINIVSTRRSFSWEEYVQLLLSHHAVLCPSGNLAAFNTRTYEAITSGRVAIQQLGYTLSRHQRSLGENAAIVYFDEQSNLLETFENALDQDYQDPTSVYLTNNLFSRLATVLCLV